MILEVAKKQNMLFSVSRRIHGKSYNLGYPEREYMNTTDLQRRTVHVCFTPEQLKVVEEYAKRRGMLNASQALEEIALDNN